MPSGTKHMFISLAELVAITHTYFLWDLWDLETPIWGLTTFDVSQPLYHKLPITLDFLLMSLHMHWVNIQ